VRHRVCVCVMCVVQDLKSGSDDRTIVSEAMMLQRLRPHVNVVAFFGICVEPTFSLVFECVVLW
jgi:hypothetical protein